MGSLTYDSDLPLVSNDIFLVSTFYTDSNIRFVDDNDAKHVADFDPSTLTIVN